ncbi:MAG: hypothetical protein IPG74_01580 [Flavobacteriales bacterium]|nr:hypothetical protein [Flavobacteriales bacterium]
MPNDRDQSTTMDAIRNWLHTYSELSDAEWTQFKGHLYSEHLKKRMCFVMADDVMESVAFVTKVACRRSTMMVQASCEH